MAKMTRSKITILALMTMLIVSNAWWIYHALDNGVTSSHATVSLDDHQQALDQCLTVLPIVASGQASREEIVKSLEAEFGLSDGFEKDGVFWIGKIGLQFDQSGKLLEVHRAWN